MINELIKLANHLDNKGYYKEVNYLDALIRKHAQGRWEQEYTFEGADAKNIYVALEKLSADDWRQVLTVVDPTGALSIPDIPIAVSTMNREPSLLNAVFLVFSILGVVPGMAGVAGDVGKLGVRGLKGAVTSLKKAKEVLPPNFASKVAEAEEKLVNEYLRKGGKIEELPAQRMVGERRPDDHWNLEPAEPGAWDYDPVSGKAIVFHDGLGGARNQPTGRPPPPPPLRPGEIELDWDRLEEYGWTNRSHGGKAPHPEAAAIREIDYDAALKKELDALNEGNPTTHVRYPGSMISDRLLRQYVAGVLDPAEMAEVAEWVATDPSGNLKRRADAIWRELNAPLD